WGGGARALAGPPALCAAGAAAAAPAGVKGRRGVKPTEFPVSSDEIRRDWRAVSESWTAAEPEVRAVVPEPVIPPPEPGAPGTPREDRVENLEDRYRAGAE